MAKNANLSNAKKAKNRTSVVISYIYLCFLSFGLIILQKSEFFNKN